jgi:hypothetical protein
MKYIFMFFIIFCIYLTGCRNYIEIAGNKHVVGSDAPNDINVNIQVFPSDNPWNTKISSNSVHANSANFINSIGVSAGIHPDFGTVWNGAPNGIPFIVVSGNQQKVNIDFVSWPSESDPGPYPIPNNAPIEGGENSTGDRHVLVIDRDNHLLFELGNAYKGNTGWTANCGAVWDLNSNKLRTEGWTSVDAAGLPVFAGLVRYDEVANGVIKHALRFTVKKSCNGYIHPATHFAGSTNDRNYPPMGLRLRLKSSFDISSFSASNKVILTALKQYGMIVADNGSSMYISGAPDSRWDDDDLSKLSQVKCSDFEAVDTGSILP